MSKPRNDSRNETAKAQELLELAQESSTKSAQQAEVPRGFATALALVSALWSSTYGQVAGHWWYWGVLIFFGLAAWVFLWKRRRPKPRTLKVHTRRYLVYAMVMIFTMQLSTFWIPDSAPVILLKFAGIFAIFLCSFWGMRREEIKARVKDGNEQAH